MGLRLRYGHGQVVTALSEAPRVRVLVGQERVRAAGKRLAIEAIRQLARERDGLSRSLPSPGINMAGEPPFDPKPRVIEG
jgi:hypothetical protein